MKQAEPLDARSAYFSTPKKEALRSSETLLNFYQTKQRSQSHSEYVKRTERPLGE
jgi:hypothetical protein